MADIKGAFLTLSKKHHPDRNPASKAKDASRKFTELHKAYSVLMDPAKRSAYDQKLFGMNSSVHPNYTSGVDEECFGFYKYKPQANAYTYARAYNYYDFTESEWEDLKQRSGTAPHKKTLQNSVFANPIYGCRLSISHHWDL